MSTQTHPADELRDTTAVIWQHTVQMMATPVTPPYASTFAIAVAEAMVGPEEPCPSVEERRSAFAIQVLYLVEEIAEAVRVNGLPELRRLPRDAGQPVVLGLDRSSLRDRLRTEMRTLWFLKFRRAPDAIRANLHLIGDLDVSATLSTLIEQTEGAGETCA